MQHRRDRWSMSCRVLGIVVAMLFLCAPPEATRAAAQEALDGPAADGEDREAFEDTTSAALLREAQQQGSLKIIVELKTAFRREGEFLSVQEALSQSRAIAQGQDQLLAVLSNRRIRDIKRFEYAPYVAMAVDEPGLVELVKNPAVGRIFKDEMVPPGLEQSVPLISADDVWASGFTGEGWAVAILDTGVDKGHVFLDQGKVVSEACYSTTDPNQLVSSVCPNRQTSQIGAGAGVHCPLSIDGCDHGTHVAGIAAGNASGTTREDFNGVAKDASIIAIQVFSRVDDVSTCTAIGRATPCALTFLSDVGRGLERVFALRGTFKIAAVNLSLGGGGFTSPCDAQSPLTGFIQNLRSVNIASVIASGNSGFIDGIGQPACISSAISVGNTTKSDTVSSSSNSTSFLSLLAPGTSIVSAVPGNGLAGLTGTSMAAPHVTGAFALLKQAKSSASVIEILVALQSTGVPITDTRNNITKPRIDVNAALDALTRDTGTPTITSPTPGSTLTGASVTFQWTANGAPVLEWWLYIGTSQGESDVYNSGSLGTRLSTTVSGIPTDGGRLFVRLWFRVSEGWQFSDFRYTAARSTSGAIP